MSDRLATATAILSKVPLNLFHQGMNPLRPSDPHTAWCQACKLQAEIVAFLAPEVPRAS